MDNLTHSIIGLVAGEAVAQCTSASEGGLPAAQRRGLLVTMGVVGGNLPDLDLIVTSVGVAPGKLGYLLHHRGHTHTVIGCVALAALLYVAARAWVHFRRLPLNRGDQVSLAAMALSAVLLHLVMDYFNSYGVHPFWPFQDGWVYGDSVFIVEPLYWIAAAPLFFTVRTQAARIALGIALVLALGANVFMHWSQPAWYLCVVALTLGLLFIGRHTSARVASLTSAAASLILTVIFVTAGHTAAAHMQSLAAQSFPGEVTLDQVLTPSPTDPLCWDVLLVQTGSTRYSVRHARLSISPGPAAEQCRDVFAGQSGTAPQTAVAAPSSHEVHWLGEFSMPRGTLAALNAADCEARELLQFARVPFAVERQQRWIMGDLRFDRESGFGLSEIELAAPPGRPCRFSVPWIAPRAALLDSP